MNSFIHIVWTGPSFPYCVRKFIKVWAPYLRGSNSHFQLIVWLSKDSLAAAQNFFAKGGFNKFSVAAKKKFAGLDMDLEFIEAKINFHTFYIGLIEPLIAKQPSTIQRVFELLHQHKYYTSISNICRILVTNCCGGIYTDVDYLWPRKDRQFPKDINEFLHIFNFADSIDFYLPTIFNGYSAGVENQCVFLSPLSVGKLRPLIETMVDDMRDSMHAIELSCEFNAEYLDHRITQALSKSFFNTPEYAPLLEAYKKRSEHLYTTICHKIYAGNIHKEEIRPFSYSFGHAGEVKMLDKGTRHFHYKPISHSTYLVVVQYFLGILRMDEEDFARDQWFRFKEYFATEEMEQQFKFSCERGLPVGMYTWANPGYSRLSSLEGAAKTVEKYYNPLERGYVPVNLFEMMIVEAKNLASAAIDSNSQLREIMLIKDIVGKSSKEHFIKLPDSKRLLREILFIVEDSPGFEAMIRLINSPRFRYVKKLIDPEIENISRGDISAFVGTA